MEKENLNLGKYQDKGLKLYQYPPVQFLLMSLADLAFVFIIASKVVLNIVNVVLTLLGFTLILLLSGWFIVKKHKVRFN